METSGTIWFSIKAGTDGTISQLTYSRSPWERQHTRPHLSALLVAWDDYLDREICSMMCTLPTEQNTHHQEEDTPLLHPRRSVNATIQHHSPGAHHSITQGKWIQCNPYHSRPGMLPSHHLSPLSHNDHWGRSGHVVPQTLIPMVWSPLQDNIRLRPSIHVPLHTSINHEAKHWTKH